MTFRLDGFEIGSRLGSGGFGEVWEARQLGVDRLVAIKVGNTPIADAADQLRFERECKALGRLSTHQNIVTVYTSSQLPDGRPVLVLEYVDGGTLQHWALNNASTEPQLLNLGADLAAAVVEAHRQQILHRDLKPQNVLLRTTGEAILADFGIAHLQDGLRTVTGNVTASAAYAAPEVLDGERASEQSDLYGIGICLLAAATQSTPFTTSDDDTLYPVLTRVLTAAPPDLTEFGYSAELNSLVQRLLAKNPVERPDSGLSVLAEFQGMNAGLHRHQRVTPAATAHDDDAATGQAPTVPPSAPVSSSSSAPAPAAHVASSPEQAATPEPSTPHSVAAEPVTQAPVVAAAAPATMATPSHAPPTAPSAAPQAVPAQGDIATAAAAPYPATPVAAQPPDKSGNGVSPVALGVGLAVLLAAAALFFLFGRSDSSETVTVPTAVATAGTESASATAPDPTTQVAAGSDDEPAQAVAPASSTESVEADDSASAATQQDQASSSSPAEVIPLPITEPIAVSDSIDVALDFRDYPIALVAGQEVSVEIVSMNDSCARSEHFDLHINVLDSAGEPIGDEGWPGNWGCSGFGGSEWKAAQDGTYTVRFSSGRGGSSQSSTGTFEATIATLRRQRAPIDVTGSLVTIDGVIDRALDSTSYELDLVAGQVVGAGIESINDECARATYFDLRFALFDPNGDQVGDEEWPGNWGCQASGRWPIEIDGPHELRFFSSDDTGTFQATVGVLRSERVTLDTAERVHSVEHRFEVPRDEVDYEIELTQGQSVSAEVTSMNGTCARADHIDLYVRMLDPQGEPVGDEGWPGNWGCSGFGPWEAPADGVYRIQFFEASGGIGTFEATIGRLGG